MLFVLALRELRTRLNKVFSKFLIHAFISFSTLYFHCEHLFFFLFSPDHLLLFLLRFKINCKPMGLKFFY